MNLKLTDEDQQYYFEFKSTTDEREFQGKSALFPLVIANGIVPPRTISTSEIAAIIIGCCFVLFVLLITVFYCIRKRLSSRTWDYELTKSNGNLTGECLKRQLSLNSEKASMSIHEEMLGEVDHTNRKFVSQDIEKGQMTLNIEDDIYFDVEAFKERMDTIKTRCESPDRTNDGIVKFA